jgi:hypothetical protein
LAVGNNSLGFIALMARRGYTNEQIRVMYNYALRSDRLISRKEERWLEVEEWYLNGNRTS